MAGESSFEIQTSGSTGPPKPITIRREQLKASAALTIGTLSLKSDFKALVCISTDHIGGKMMLVRGMESGMDLIIQPPNADPSLFDPPLIDFMSLVPLQVKNLLASERGRKMLRQCQVVLIGGADLDPRLEDELRIFDNRIYQTFGMTETVSHIALRLLSAPGEDHYRVLKGVHIFQDHRGCLIASGPMTNQQPVITNDLVEIIGKSKFRWLGRADQVINSGGYKIYPPKLKRIITKALKEVAWPCEFLVVGVPHHTLGQACTLILEKDPISQLQKEQLINALKPHLHPYEMPKDIECLSDFPRTTTGKPDLRTILLKYLH